MFYKYFFPGLSFVFWLCHGFESFGLQNFIIFMHSNVSIFSWDSWNFFCLFVLSRKNFPLFTFGMDEDLMLIRRRKVLNQFVNTALLFPLDFFFFVLTISSARSKVPENTNIRGLIANLWRLHEDVNWCLNTSCSSETNDYFVGWMNQNEKLGL